MRELPGDMAHELRGREIDNEVWELSGDMIHELRSGEIEIDWLELPGDMAPELGDHRQHGNGNGKGNGVEGLSNDMAHEIEAS